MRNQLVTLILVLCSCSAYAGPYIELGIGMEIGGCVYHKWTPQPVEIHCSQSPLGSVALGYTYKGWSVEAYHISSLVEQDKGLNLLTLKYRIGK